MSASTAISGADTAWVLISTALVMLMVPGLALFYGGLVRSRAALNTVMMCVAPLGFVSLQWVLVGYSLAFAPGSGWLGGLAWAGLDGVGGAPNPAYAGTIPHLAFAAFQAMFAAITVALISGAVAERMRFRAYLLFVLLWTTLIYDPLAHWVWGDGGWLRTLGALDFAGGTVVHVSAGTSALVAALFLGPRREYRRIPILPHNVPFTLLGAGLLWFGWFGFNAGSALAANDVAASAFVTTHTAAAAALTAWMLLDLVRLGRPTAVGAATGAVVGLVAITPAAGFVTARGALDFAGGTVVHVSAGTAALVAAIILGPRRDFGRPALVPHNVPFTVLGAGLLWFGWFGFNAGSALAANETAVAAFATTFVAGAAALTTWLLIDLARTGRATAVGAATGAVVGLVAITPAAGFVTPRAALAIGAIAAGASYAAMQLRARTRLDDALDVFACHGVAGIAGALLTGVFATKAVNAAGADGLLASGSFRPVAVQALAVGATMLIAGVFTAGILVAVQKVTVLRASLADELAGMDRSQHGEEAYHDGGAGELLGVTGGSLGHSVVVIPSEAPLPTPGRSAA